ncbi:MAG: hypothetical protein M1835_001515 [Candelina submexicana]|nr:MAG: hypothetical protein M1835_001515 [Candelina submexicana]
MGDEEKIRNASVCLEQAHGQTIWNIHLESWKDENEFWSIYETKYTILIDKARKFLCSYTERLKNSSSQPPPKAAIFLSAGFDASEWESSGMQRHKVNVPTSFYARFTRDIVMLSKETETGVDERIISVLEGGYSDMALTSGVLSHLTGLAAEESTEEGQQANGLGYEMGKRIGTYDAESKITDQSPTVELNHEWWERQRLEELEAVVNPAAPPPAPKKSRNASRPTYSSTTESFNAKIVPGSTIYRNVSAGSPRPADLPSLRAPTPTQPDIHWYTATHELNKLLIPTDRQTSSCKPEDLSAPASRVRRERHSIGLPSEVEVHDGKRMQLRERKAKTPSYALDEEEEQLQAKRPAPKTSRRTTIGGAAIQAGKPATKAESIKAEKSKPSKANSKRRPSISYNRSIANTDVPPVPKTTSDATQVNDDVPKPNGNYSKSSQSILSHSSSDKLAVAGDTGNTSGPRTEGPRNRPSKRITPMVKGLPAQPDRPIKSFSPTQSITPATQSNIQIPSQTQLKQECDDLASGLKKLSIEQVSLPKDDGAKETFNTGEGIIRNQISHPNPAEREVTQALSDDQPSGRTNLATSEPWLSENDMEREKSQYIKQDTDLPSNEQDPTMTLQSAFLPIALKPSEPRLDPGIPLINGRDAGNIGQAKPTSSADHGPLESTSVTTGNGANAGVTQRLSQPFSPRHKGDLPVFTAKSLIPFGKFIADSSHSKAERRASRSDMPSTSDTMSTLLEDCQGGANDSGFPVTQEMTSNDQQVKDVWDVPETPQSRK